MISISDLITKTIRFYRDHFIILLKYTAVGLIISVLVSFIPIVGTLLAQIIQIILEIILIYLVWSILQKNEKPVTELLTLSVRKFWIFFAASVIFIILLVLGLLLLIIPAFIILTFYFLAIYILLIEDTKIIESFKKSRELVRHRELSVFFDIAATYAFFGIINIAFSIIILYFTFHGSFSTNIINMVTNAQTTQIVAYYISSSIVNILLAPLFVIFPIILYRNLKKIGPRKMIED